MTSEHPTDVPAPSVPARSSAAPAPRSSPTDVVIVGAGPAGLAAASILLRHSRLRITLADAGHTVGGQYWRRPAPSHARGGLTPEAGRDLHHDLATFDALRADLDAGVRDGRVELLTGHQVWTAVPAKDGGFAVHLVERVRPGVDRAHVRTARAVLVATGAFDRALPFPGWDLPGVMTVGGLQALLKGNDVLAGRQVAIGGTGPFLLPVAAGLAEHGARVVGVFEANAPTRWLRHPGALFSNAAKLEEGAGYAATRARHRVPVRPRTMVVAAHGSDRVEAVTIVRLDRHGRRRPGSEERIAVDAVGVGWGFTPQLDLPLTLGCELVTEPGGTQVLRVDDAQMSSRAGVFAAGEVCGVGGSALADAEGRVAGAAIASRLEGAAQAAPLDRPEVASARRDIGRLRPFAEAMQAAHPVPPAWTDALTPETTFCRCEEVPYAAVQAAIATSPGPGCGDARQLKQLTRVGMGWCQGRVCGYAADLVTSGRPGRPPDRLVAAPVTLGALADTTGADDR